MSLQLSENNIILFVLENIIAAYTMPDESYTSDRELILHHCVYAVYMRPP